MVQEVGSLREYGRSAYGVKSCKIMFVMGTPYSLVTNIQIVILFFFVFGFYCFLLLPLGEIKMCKLTNQ